MEALQLAQMLADINDLQATDQGAAKALVTANKALDGKGDAASPPPASKGSSADGRLLSPPGRFDRFGRRIFTPPLTRTNSGTGSSSIPGTPRREKEHLDDDIDRASTLLSLYEIRAKLKEQDNSSLLRAREKINALAAKQEKNALEQKTVLPREHKHSTSASRISYPK